MSLLRIGLAVFGGYAFWKAFAMRESLPEGLQYLTVTSTGIDNQPPKALFAAVERLHRLVQAIEKSYGAIRVTSGYRSAGVNAAVPGASSTSLHMQARAIDFVPVDVSPEKIYDDWRKAPHVVTGLVQRAILYILNEEPVRLHVSLAAVGTEPTPEFFRDQETRI